MKTAMLHAFEQAITDKKATPIKEDPTLIISVSELHKNLKDIIKMLDRGVFIELQKHHRKIGMIVPY